MQGEFRMYWISGAHGLLLLGVGAGCAVQSTNGEQTWRWQSERSIGPWWYLVDFSRWFTFDVSLQIIVHVRSRKCSWRNYVISVRPCCWLITFFSNMTNDTSPQIQLNFLGLREFGSMYCLIGLQSYSFIRSERAMRPPPENCYDSLLWCVISRCTRRELRSAKPDGHGFRQRALPSPSQEAETCEEESQAPELRIPRQSLQPFIWTRDLPWPPLRHLVWIQRLRTHSNSSSIEPPTTALKLLCRTLLRAAILRGLRRLQAIQQIQRLLKPFWINVNNLTQYPQGWCSRCSLKLWATCLGLLFSTWLIRRQDLSQVLEVNYHPWSRRVSNSVDIATVLKWNRVD